MTALTLHQALTPFKRRLQWRSSLTILGLTLGVGLGLTLILLAIGRIWPVLFQAQLSLVGLLVTLALIVCGQLYVWLRPPSLTRLARLGDAYLGLEERLTTAVELADGSLETDQRLKEAQFDDTLRRLAQVPLADRLPLARRRRLLTTLLLLLLLFGSVVGLALWPNPQDQLLQEQVEVEQAIETEIAQLQQLQANLLSPETTALPDPHLEELSLTLDELIDRLEQARANGSPEQALAALAAAEQSLQEVQEEATSQQQTLATLADALSESDSTTAQSLADSLKQGEYDQAAQSLRQAGQNPPGDQAEQQALSDSLQQAADNLAQTNPELADNLQQASDSLESGDTAAAQEALDQAAEQLSQAGEQAQGQPQVDQALENIDQARQELAQQDSAAGQNDSQAQNQGQPQQGQQAQQADGQSQSQQGQQSQQSQQGQSGQQGQQSGEQAQSGQSAQSQQGDSTSTGEAGSAEAESQSSSGGPDTSPNEGRLEEYNSVYAPSHLGGEGGPQLSPNAPQTDNRGAELGETAPNADRPAGEAMVPYTEVYQEYRNQAATALENSQVPLSMRDYIRQYFGALEPK